MSRVVVHIGRLVVPGPASRREVEAAIEAAIRCELGRPGAGESVAATGDRRSVDASRVGAGAGMSGLGTVIARGISGRGK